MIILGIETSCDETSVAIYDTKKKVIFENTNSQIKIHNKYGGTIPELASRNHIKNISKLFILTMKKSKIILKDINLIAYTYGPGLIGSLFIGASFGKALSYSLGIPSIGINHLEAHILIAFLYNKDLKFPCLALLVSGAHTMFIKVLNYHNYELIGETIDDGAGETFDKISRTLNFRYYNGVSIEKASLINKRFCNYNFPKPLGKKDNLNFSFSGLKTAIINKIRSDFINKRDFNTVAYNFQSTIIKTISRKCKLAIKITNVKSLILAGGVSANKSLRKELFNLSNSIGVKMYTSPLRHCTDNGTMIAFTGYIKYIDKKFDKNFYLNVNPGLNFDNI
ncbi:MAG TPA: tRNA (adenosine(37)-N6)-threonylcarbamoyltransferase complex transferase subunit TsaD [Candidatus Azoamicus sp. OHIO1]